MARRKTRKRRNPAGSLMVLNPRRRRRRTHAASRRRRSNPSHLFRARRRHVTHRRRRRNPGLGGIARGGRILGLPLKGAVSIVVGVLAVKALGNQAAKMFPQIPEGPIKKFGLPIAAAVAASFLARKFMGKGMGDAVATGGAVAVVLGIVNEYVAPHVPLLADYQDTWSGPGVQAYLPTGMSDGSQWAPSMG